MAVLVGFSAYSGVGKTTLLEKVIPRLCSLGLRVTVLKHDVHGIAEEEEGKDSARLRRAGARVVLLGPETGEGEAATEVLLRTIRQIRDADVVLVEGFKLAPIPRIGMYRSGSGKPLPDKPERYLAVVTDRPIPGTKNLALEDIEGVTALILEQTEQDFTHFNEQGRARMVDVGEKEESTRTAVAAGRVLVNAHTFALIRSGGMKKGDVLTVAQVAGIMGAKRTPDLIPMCHPIALSGIDLDLSLDEARLSVEITATVRCQGKTGVEMEALNAVSAAALTVYDMCKAVQKDMVITDIRLLEKTGGVHGEFHRKEG